MRLRESRIQQLAKAIASSLVEGHYVTDVTRDQLEVFVFNAIHQDLKREDDLDEEVRRIMTTYQTDIDRGRVQYHTMFKLIKTKLAKDRNMIL
ncbi:MAG: DUF507 family protein [Candidatus Schekmanbacteria bacterium]|nr:DUF507 family protein [Candidatus Schekmanbacteria bacterium]